MRALCIVKQHCRIIIPDREVHNILVHNVTINIITNKCQTDYKK